MYSVTCTTGQRYLHVMCDLVYYVLWNYGVRVHIFTNMYCTRGITCTTLLLHVHSTGVKLKQYSLLKAKSGKVVVSSTGYFVHTSFVFVTQVIAITHFTGRMYIVCT